MEIRLQINRCLLWQTHDICTFLHSAKLLQNTKLSTNQRPRCSCLQADWPMRGQCLHVAIVTSCLLIQLESWAVSGVVTESGDTSGAVTRSRYWSVVSARKYFSLIPVLWEKSETEWLWWEMVKSAVLWFYSLINHRKQFFRSLRVSHSTTFLRCCIPGDRLLSDHQDIVMRWRLDHNHTINNNAAESRDLHSKLLLFLAELSL